MSASKLNTTKEPDPKVLLRSHLQRCPPWAGLPPPVSAGQPFPATVKKNRKRKRYNKNALFFLGCFPLGPEPLLIEERTAKKVATKKRTHKGITVRRRDIIFLIPQSDLSPPPTKKNGTGIPKVKTKVRGVGTKGG